MPATLQLRRDDRNAIERTHSQSTKISRQQKNAAMKPMASKCLRFLLIDFDIDDEAFIDFRDAARFRL